MFRRSCSPYCHLHLHNRLYGRSRSPCHCQYLFDMPHRLQQWSSRMCEWSHSLSHNCQPADQEQPHPCSRSFSPTRHHLPTVTYNKELFKAAFQLCYSKAAIVNERYRVEPILSVMQYQYSFKPDPSYVSMKASVAMRVKNSKLLHCVIGFDPQ